MSTQKKSGVRISRSRRGTRAVRQMGIARAVVLDQIGFVKHRRGHGVLRLKLVGPVESLQRLCLEEGERVAIVRHHLIGENAV